MSATAEIAMTAQWTRRLVKAESVRLGIKPEQARKVVARKLKTSPGTLENIARLRTKLLPGWLRDRIRREFVAALQSEMQRLEHEINVARQIGMDNREDALCEAEAQLQSARKILEAA